MVSFMQLWTMIRATGPVFYLMANAFAYGARKFGDGTWKQLSAGDHLESALNNIIAWKRGDTGQPVLVDAALRIVFAVAVAISQGQQPEEYKKQ